MDIEKPLSRAAECLILAVESADPHQQVAMLKMAQMWIDNTARIRSGNQPEQEKAA